MNKQRKGQFIWNAIVATVGGSMEPMEIIDQQNRSVGFNLWNISDTQFDRLMEKWAKQK